MLKRKTYEELVEEVKVLHPNIEIIGGREKYKNNFSKVKCRCKIDGEIWESNRSNLVNKKHGCPVCGGSKKLTHELFVKQMREINPDIEIIENYINSNTPILVRCKKCGHEWKARPYHLKRGKGCPICRQKEVHDKLRKNQKIFEEELSIISPRIEIIGKYKSHNENILCKCKICGHEWEATPANLVAGKGCPACRQSSKGENRIKDWLEENNINFKMHYRFKDCVNKKPLPFDFYLEEYNLCIEYDGPQHFKPTLWFGSISQEEAEKVLVEGQKRDTIKTKYCEEKNIRLLRISYKDFKKINEILTNTLL